jgi:hypothetical protein
MWGLRKVTTKSVISLKMFSSYDKKQKPYGRRGLENNCLKRQMSWFFKIKTYHKRSNLLIIEYSSRVADHCV